jgi:hypothetical protein
MYAENGVVPALSYTSVWRRTGATCGSNVNWCPELELAVGRCQGSWNDAANHLVFFALQGISMCMMPVCRFGSFGLLAMPCQGMRGFRIDNTIIDLLIRALAGK